MADGATRIIERIRSLARYNPMYVPDDSPFDDLVSAMHETSDGLFIKWEDVVTAIIPSIGDVSVSAVADHNFGPKAIVMSRVEIVMTAAPPDLNAILVSLNQKILTNFEQQREQWFRTKGGKA